MIYSHVEEDIKITLHGYTVVQVISSETAMAKERGTGMEGSNWSIQMGVTMQNIVLRQNTNAQFLLQSQAITYNMTVHKSKPSNDFYRVESIKNPNKI